MIIPQKDYFYPIYQFIFTANGVQNGLNKERKHHLLSDNNRDISKCTNNPSIVVKNKEILLLDKNEIDREDKRSDVLFSEKNESSISPRTVYGNETFVRKECEGSIKIKWEVLTINQILDLIYFCINTNRNIYSISELYTDIFYRLIRSTYFSKNQLNLTFRSIWMSRVFHAHFFKALVDIIINNKKIVDSSIFSLDILLCLCSYKHDKIYESLIISMFDICFNDIDKILKNINTQILFYYCFIFLEVYYPLLYLKVMKKRRNSFVKSEIIKGKLQNDETYKNRKFIRKKDNFETNEEKESSSNIIDYNLEQYRIDMNFKMIGKTKKMSNNLRESNQKNRINADKIVTSRINAIYMEDSVDTATTVDILKYLKHLWFLQQKKHADGYDIIKSRSNSLLKDKEIDKVLFLNNCENSIFSDSDMEDQKKLKFKGEKGKGDTLKKKKNALNCFFVNSAKHSLVPDDYKDEIDDLQIIDRNHVNNANYEINKKLEEWKDVVEKLEKINNVISIFIFNILNYSSFNNYEAKQRRTKEFQHNQIYYLKERCSNYLEMSITLIKKLYEDKKRTDQNILIYLNNEYEIDVVKRGLRNKNIESTHIEIIYDAYRDDIDLYELKNKIIIVKDVVFYFYNKFKNVKYMIDTCFMKDKIYDYDLNVTNEFTVLCSKSICEERRLACNSSICFRLITLNDYMDLLDEFPIPEILKKDIFYNIYFLKTIGIKNICSFDFVTAPMLKSLKRCFELFYILKLMDIDGNIIDKKLSLLICYLPLKFKYSIFLLNSIRYKCVGEVSIIISMLINEPIFLYNSKNVNRLKTMRLSLMAEESDILSYYNIFQNFEMAKNKKSFCNDNFLVYRSIKKATKFFIKLKRILHDFGIDMERSNNIEFIFKAKISAFFYNVSKVVKDNKYELLNKRSGPRLFHLDSLSVLNEREEAKRKFIVYTDAYSNNESRIFIRHASIIDPSWLTNVCPSYFSNQHEQKFEEVQT
ncbi:conserved protein, unknown function [Plasmodium malariae]|uniref:DEAD-box helicase OB fold domain-containing protein n=1 Tax=Plasmodium malariae TaxID=5858 RepID=A0A1C3L1Y3_PLAMA|nr:conserved protein, unknown function [Plasmodium malariae]